MARVKFEQIIETKLIAPNIEEFQYFFDQFDSLTKH